MSYRDEILAARNEGRAASLGDPNPYSGTGSRARMWRLGYRTMLLDLLNRSPARQDVQRSE
ncbi:hypothetical protein I5H06_gp92 [Mycobacterium phage SirPhilip]|uniref:Uncharacterized protein n=1 Tax=Mycobacterium phage SirPhilip TaxID=2015824 RepID=A0A222ZLP0_9CAUD|nr:hypothetical protein I5H06_gp92 [Mycobacterium phage SirPhilip]ASR85212.1 hypothetical protein SEA_SIRPHILIP_10 [Mycobacterium phage SirPhilip]